MSVIPGSARQQIVDGASFVLDAPTTVPAIAGRAREVWWAAGEALWLVGPQGVGKTTLQQQLALRRAGVLDGDLIGMPVEPDRDRATVYLALDRPSQIARSFRRMLDEDARPRLGRLAVWRGPLPFNLLRQPERFVDFVREIGDGLGMETGTVFVDSVKDIAAPLSGDEVGAAVNRAFGGVVAQGIELCVNHHQRKSTADNRKPSGLADVFGSTWLTAGAGSVILLWGEPGDPLVELTHLKQPAEEIGPLDLAHDHERGTTTVRERPDAWSLLQGATSTGITALDVARATYGNEPSRAQVEKARRRLDKFVERGHATRINGSQKSDPTLYRPTADVSLRDRPREGVTHPSRPITNGTTEHHAPITHPHPSRSPLKEWGKREGEADHELTRLTSKFGGPE